MYLLFLNKRDIDWLSRQIPCKRMLLVCNAERIFMLLGVDSLNKVKIKKRANLLGIDQ